MIEKEIRFKLKAPNAGTVAKFLRNIVVVLVVLLTIMGSILYGKVNNEQTIATKAAQELLSSHCAFFRDLGTVPLQPSTTPQGQKVPPSRLGLQIVNDSRKAYDGIGCRPKLPPNPSLNAYAKQEGFNLK